MQTELKRGDSRFKVYQCVHKPEMVNYLLLNDQQEAFEVVIKQRRLYTNVYTSFNYSSKKSACIRKSM